MPKSVVPDPFEPKSDIYILKPSEKRGHERYSVREKSRVKKEACHMASKILIV